MRVETNYKYKLDVAENYLCVAAVLQCILQLYDIELSQKEIASYFTLFIPENNSDLKELGKLTKDSNKFGIVLKDSDINRFFSSLKIKLYEKYYKINLFEDWELEDFLVNHLQKNAHLICGFSYGELYNDTKNINIGHVALITGVSNNKIHIIDPGPKKHGEKIVELSLLFRAIHKKKDGIWVIQEVN